MPRDTFRLFFDERTRARTEMLHGELVSPVRLVILGANNVLMPVADIRISAHLISAVPVAANNHEMIYAKPGSPIEVRRSTAGRLEIVGLSKRGHGNINQFTVQIANGPMISTTTTNGIIVTPIGKTSLVPVSIGVIGYSVRTATLGELATATSGGFGTTPLQGLLLINASGTIVQVYP